MAPTDRRAPLARFQRYGQTPPRDPADPFLLRRAVGLYGTRNYLISQAASYAVENWAAAGFWDELIAGFNRYNARNGENLPLAFFTWHARLEAQHAKHTQEELEELYFERELDEDAFIRFGNEMLDGVAAFWEGLNEDRLALARQA